MNKLGINQSTIIEPYLFFYYLDQLARMLTEQGYSNLLFSVYNMQLIIINSVLKMDMGEKNQNKLISFNCYIRLKLINLCVELNCIQAVAFHQQLLTDMLITPDPLNPVAPNMNTTSPSNLLKLLQIDPLEACIVREQIYAQKQRVSHMQDEEAIQQAQSVLSFAVSASKAGSPIKSQRKKNHRTAKIRINDGSGKKIVKNKTDDIKLPGENRSIHDAIHDILYQDVWIVMSETLIDNGHFQLARDFLYESLNAAKVSWFKFGLKSILYIPVNCHKCLMRSVVNKVSKMFDI